MNWPAAAVVMMAIFALMVIITTYLGTRSGKG
jgi:hypothetical protein